VSLALRLLAAVADRDQTRQRRSCAGACGYVLKESAEGELIDAVRAALAGRSYFSPKVRRLLRAEHVEELRTAGGDE
jgi:DNA-binding NarL/FixJ family response regulator